jgi:hypothetical protein
MFMVKNKRGGNNRAVVSPLGQGDSFVLPNGWSITKVYAESNSYLGNTVDVAIGTDAPVEAVGRTSIWWRANDNDNMYFGGVALADYDVYVTNLDYGRAIAHKVYDLFGPEGDAQARFELLQNGWEVTGITDIYSHAASIHWKGSPRKYDDTPGFDTDDNVGLGWSETSEVEGDYSDNVLDRSCYNACYVGEAKEMTSHLNSWGSMLGAYDEYTTDGRMCYVSSDLLGVGRMALYVEIQKMN